jgi:hypothetical protein
LSRQSLALLLVATDSKNASGATCALAAMLASGLKTCKFQEFWVNYFAGCETLKKEVYLNRAAAHECSGAADRDAGFVRRAEGPIWRENTLGLST